MKKSYKKTFPNNLLGGIKCCFIFLTLCMFGLNNSCSDDLNEFTENDTFTTKSASVEGEQNDTVLNYIKQICSTAYIESYISSVATEKEISKDSAYLEYLTEKYVYLINNFYNNEKYDNIDPISFLVKPKINYRAPRGNIYIEDVIVYGDLYGYGVSCLRKIQSDVVRCIGGEKGFLCSKMMMAYTLELFRTTDLESYRFMCWLYDASNKFSNSSLSGLVPDYSSRMPNRSNISDCLSDLRSRTSSFHFLMCQKIIPGGGGGGSGGSGGSGGGGDGGGTNPPTDPNPELCIYCGQQNCYGGCNCGHAVCLRCEKCFPTEARTKSLPTNHPFCLCWDKNGHNMILLRVKINLKIDNDSNGKKTMAIVQKLK